MEFLRYLSVNVSFVTCAMLQVRDHLAELASKPNLTVGKNECELNDQPVGIQHWDVHSSDFAESRKDLLEDVLAGLVLRDARLVVRVHEPLGRQILKRKEEI